MKYRLVRITTVPISMNILLKDQLRFMNQYYEVKGVTGYDEKHFIEIGEREGIEMQVVEMSRTIAPWKDLKALWQLVMLFKKEKPQVVHTHTPKAGLLGMLAAQLTGVPVRLHTVAGMPLLETKGAKRLLLNFIEKVTYRCAHKVYPNSFGLQQIILNQRFCPQAKLKVLGNGSSNGINVDFFSPEPFAEQAGFWEDTRAKWGIDKRDFVFCFVGRLAKEKGITELVDAFERLQKDLAGSENVKLLLVGPLEKANGALDEKTQKKIKDNPSILNVGRHDDIRPFLFISDIFVFPSYREGFPGVVLQAGAMGLASIVSNINGCNEIILEGKNGLIIAPKNMKQLNEAMQKVLQDQVLLKRLASKAREMVLQKFRREIVWEALLQEYNFHTSALMKKENVKC